jgi:hypothetical protein
MIFISQNVANCHFIRYATAFLQHDLAIKRGSSPLINR